MMKFETWIGEIQENVTFVSNPPNGASIMTPSWRLLMQSRSTLPTRKFERNRP